MDSTYGKGGVAWLSISIHVLYFQASEVSHCKSNYQLKVFYNIYTEYIIKLERAVQILRSIAF